MSDDALQAMNAYDSDEYDKLLKDAETDSRVGKHDFLVTKVVEDTWPSGDARLKVSGVLTTARNAKTDFTWSPPPAPEVVAAEKSSWEPGKLRAIANAVSIARQLRQHYGKSPNQIQEGDVYRVQTNKSRRDKVTGEGGFVRIFAFLPQSTSTNGAGGASAGVGF